MELLYLIKNDTGEMLRYPVKLIASGLAVPERSGSQCHTQGYSAASKAFVVHPVVRSATPSTSRHSQGCSRSHHHKASSLGGSISIQLRKEPQMFLV